MTKSRGVRGAAGGCAVASLVYLLARGLLTLLVSALMGLAHPGASLAKPLGFSGVSTALFQLLIGLGAIVLTLVFLLKVTRLKTKDLRIMLPAPWSPRLLPAGFSRRGEPCQSGGRTHQPPDRQPRDQ